MIELLNVVGSLLLGVFRRSTLKKAPLNCLQKEKNGDHLSTSSIPFGLRFPFKSVNCLYTWGLAALIMSCLFFCGFGESSEAETLAHTCMWPTAALKSGGQGCAMGTKSTYYRGSRSLSAVGASPQAPLVILKELLLLEPQAAGVPGYEFSLSSAPARQITNLSFL